MRNLQQDQASHVNACPLFFKLRVVFRCLYRFFYDDTSPVSGAAEEFRPLTGACVDAAGLARSCTGIDEAFVPCLVGRSGAEPVLRALNVEPGGGEEARNYKYNNK
jgi:hypothetical protein